MSYTKGTFIDGTKGWKAVPYEKLVGFATHEIHWSDDGECIAEVVHGANDAKLIAAAPDLAEAIQYYFDVLDEVRGEDWDKKPDHVLQKMLAAMTKAGQR